MHEIAVVQALLELAGTFVPSQQKATRVGIEVGELEHLDDSVMQTVWAAMAAETVFAQATLEIVRTPVVLVCRSCQREYAPDADALYRCPQCHAALPEVRRGSGVTLARIEMDDQPFGKERIEWRFTSSGTS